MGGGVEEKGEERKRPEEYDETYDGDDDDDDDDSASAVRSSPCVLMHRGSLILVAPGGVHVQVDVDANATGSGEKSGDHGRGHCVVDVIVESAATAVLSVNGAAAVAGDR